MRFINIKTLDIYIGKTILFSTLMALLIIVSLDTFFAFINETNDIIKGQYSLANAAIYIAFTMPRRIHELFPMAILLGTLIGLGSLAKGSELIIMRAIGFSIFRITASVVGSGIIMLIFIVLLGELVAPAAEQFAKTERDSILHRHISTHTKNGNWLRIGEEFINIREMLDPEHLRDIHIYSINSKHQMYLATHANSAIYNDGRWELTSVKQSTISEDGVITLPYSSKTWNSPLLPSMLNVLVIEPVELSSWNLFRYVQYLKENNLDAHQYELAVFKRLFSPFSAIVMLLLAIPFVFGPLRSASAGQRIMIGVLVSFGYNLMSEIFSQAGQLLQVSSFFSVASTPSLFLLVSIFLIRRLNSKQ